VLIVGESGTGKELVARTIHRQSPRSGAPFFAVNCGALSEGLLESEIFGHERGAFTGAIATKKGFFEVAEQGTLFLDEISETSPAFQTRLLRVLQEGEFRRVGGTRSLKTDIRLISSTNRDPRKCVSDGRLREDLFYRLSVVQIILPPLRERATDIPLLADHFIQMDSTRIKKRIRGITPEAMDALRGYRWPGNIRELENVIERAIIMAEEDGRIELEDLPADIATGHVEEPRPTDEVRELERDILVRALRECDGNRSQAARKLGIGRRTLYDRMARYGISPKPNF
jgi:transcriptional regulator with PAS, ATPase and Fis domain